MKFGTIIIDLDTGRRGYLESLPVRTRPKPLRGVWAAIDKRRVYVRNWAKACYWRKWQPINPELLKLARKT